MLDTFVSWLLLYSVVKHWFKQTLYIIFFTRILFLFFIFSPVNKADTIFLSNSMSWFGVHLVIEQWFKKKLCVSISQSWFFFTIKIWNRVDTWRYLIYCVDKGKVYSSNIDLSRHLFKDILPIRIQIISILYQWIKQTLCVNKFTVLIRGTFVDW